MRSRSLHSGTDWNEFLTMSATAQAVIGDDTGAGDRR